MDTLNRSKINKLFTTIVPGIVVTSRYLSELGISKELARRYVDSGWLTRIGRGAFVRSGDSVEWPGALFALQRQLKLSVHVGGLSALELKGLGHFLPLGEEKIQLVSDRVERMPTWFKNHDWGVVVEHRIMSLFDPQYSGFVNVQTYKGIEIAMSSAERASLEMLSQVHSNSEFDAARIVFDGLPTMRPKAVQELLEACRSVRVKRMFLWMAKECGHPWSKHLELSRIDLGAGKRVIYTDGKMDVEFQITVPRDDGSRDV